MIPRPWASWSGYSLMGAVLVAAVATGDARPVGATLWLTAAALAGYELVSLQHRLDHRRVRAVAARTARRRATIRRTVYRYQIPRPPSGRVWPPPPRDQDNRRDDGP